MTLKRFTHFCERWKDLSFCPYRNPARLDKKSIMAKLSSISNLFFLECWCSVCSLLHDLQDTDLLSPGIIINSVSPSSPSLEGSRHLSRSNIDIPRSSGPDDPKRQLPRKRSDSSTYELDTIKHHQAFLSRWDTEYGLKSPTDFISHAQCSIQYWIKGLATELNIGWVLWQTSCCSNHRACSTFQWHIENMQDRAWLSSTRTGAHPREVFNK